MKQMTLGVIVLGIAAGGAIPMAAYGKPAAPQPTCATPEYVDAQTERILGAVEALAAQVLAAQVACEGADGGGACTTTVQCPDVPAGYRVCKQRRNGTCRPTRTYLTPVGTYAPAAEASE